MVNTVLALSAVNGEGYC